ncbi:MAG TPA: arginine decarboxylase [Cyanothece sp. UBA12306]|nr:arginine decarboxylase [Cyanothece sp. UBA12306]
MASDWSIEDSVNLYHLKNWGSPYFSINRDGHITVTPHGEGDKSLDLYNLIQSLQSRNIRLPFLIRFSDILAARLAQLNECFNHAIIRYDYNNKYQGVYPIKCNPDRHVVQSIVDYGAAYNFGLEVGSKPELMIALAMLKPRYKNPDSSPIIICNGYKDSAYIQTALLATRLGYKLIIVIEQLEELYSTVNNSIKLGIEPHLGIRAKLNTKGSGRWGNSTGDRAKFGLTMPQIVTVIDYLKSKQILHYLQLLHFHIGSQISSISVIKSAIREASQIYIQLIKINPNMKYLDVGGGLGVDYNGSKTNFDASKNYDMQNYANDIVAAVKEACDEANIQVPILISESGRAISAHHSILIFNVLNTNDVSTVVLPHAQENDHLIIRNLWEIYESINEENYQENYNDAIQMKEEAISLFKFGYLSLIDRAKAERLYWVCCQKIHKIIKNLDSIPHDLKDLEKIMASIYYTNLSVFRAAPDAWAINQLFPIMPIHRLEEEPTKRAILADLTCDSDGKIDQFINLRKTKSVLELHTLQPLEITENNNSSILHDETMFNQPYYLGMFLVGAYQEIMGNFHNLFGDLNVVHISLNSQGYQVEHLVRGDTIKEVLGYVQYNQDELLEIIRQRTEEGIQKGKISLEEAQKLWQNYENTLDYYTYLTALG